MNNANIVRKQFPLFLFDKVISPHPSSYRIMNTISNQKIAIIGGGPGGLTLARLLQMSGANVTVYERDEHKDARAKGATLDLHHESGLAALEAAGLMDEFKAAYRPEAGFMRIMNKEAQICFDESINGEDGFNRPEIDRGPLNDILYQSLEPETVVWNSRFASISKVENGWQIEFKNGTSAFADIVIGADGANSKVRPYITLLTPVYSGNTIVEGTVYHSETSCPNMHKLVNGGKIFALSDAKTLVVSAKGDGSLVFYTGCNKDETWSRESGIDFTNKAQVIAWFQQEFTGWSDAWLELFEAATEPFILRPQYCMPLDKVWQTLPNLTLIGDAAHVMPPYAGEGVNMAMLDALELSRFLLSKDYTDSLSALAAYENSMHKRFAEVGKETMDNTAWMHSEDNLSLMLNFFKHITD